MIKRNIRSSFKKYADYSDNPVDVKDYVDINNRYNQFLLDKVLDGHKVTLPSRMGTLAIEGKKHKINFDENGEITGLAPDWVKTKQLWAKDPEAKKKRTRVFHLNDNTDGYRYKFVWSKLKVLVTNKTLYSLRMTRTNKRAVHKAIVAGKKYINKN